MIRAEIFDKKKHWKEINTIVADLQSRLDIITHIYLLHSQVPAPKYQCLYSKIDSLVSHGDIGWSEQTSIQDKLE